MNSILYAASIGTFATWLGVSGASSVGILVPGKPQVLPGLKHVELSPIIMTDGEFMEVDMFAGGSAAASEVAEENMNGVTPEQPEQATLRAETRRLLEAKIDELPSGFRTVFMLRALEEMSVEETAACLGIPEATVRTRYFRARGMLREGLMREIDFVFEDAFAFAGERCDRIVSAVLQRIARDT